MHTLTSYLVAVVVSLGTLALTGWPAGLPT